MTLNDPQTLALFAVVLPFWAAVLVLNRRRGRRSSPRLFLLPSVFLVLGLGLNRQYPRVGTYVVVGVHVLMLPALWRIAKMRP